MDNRQHDLISKLKEIAVELQHTPSRDEYLFNGGGHSYKTVFGNWATFIQASGLEPTRTKQAKAKPFKFKFKHKKIESFNIHEADLADLIAKANLKQGETLRVVLMPDTHVENMSVEAVEAFLEFVEWYQPHVFIIVGDFLDAAGISHWPPNDLKPRNFIREIKEARALLNRINGILNQCVLKVFLTGNHEDWIHQAMVQKMPEFFNGLDEIGLMPDLKSLLDLDRLGFDLLPVNHFFKIGKCHWTHGILCGNNHQKKHLERVKASVYYGHTHDQMNYHDSTMDGTIESGSCACLCRLDPPFLKGKPNNWVNGFNTFEFFNDGKFTVNQIKIFYGRFSYLGIQFGGK